MSNLKTNVSRSLGPNVFGIASREMDELFDRLFHTNGNGHSRQWVPPMTVWEEGECFYLELDLPGLREDDIEVTFEDSKLKISAKREREDDQNRKYLRDERNWGELDRVVSVPESVDPESIEASYDAGVLRFQFAKLPEVMPKRIEITKK